MVISDLEQNWFVRTYGSDGKRVSESTIAAAGTGVYGCGVAVTGGLEAVDPPGIMLLDAYLSPTTTSTS